jgi:hypothetical protein
MKHAGCFPFACLTGRTLAGCKNLRSEPACYLRFSSRASSRARSDATVRPPRSHTWMDTERELPRSLTGKTKAAWESGLRRGEERRFAAERRSHTSSAETAVLFSPEAASPRPGLPERDASPAPQPAARIAARRPGREALDRQPTATIWSCEASAASKPSPSTNWRWKSSKVRSAPSGFV